ncbi:MAG: Na+/H+ antiporter subunit E [Burkholderiaceae bacterium]
MMLRALMMRAVLFALLWWVLTGGAHDAWGVGAATIALAVAVSLRLRAPGPFRFSILRVPGFLAFFLLESIKGGVQVAGMALRPRLDLQPTTMEIHLRLPDESARMFLAATLSLLPGTLSFGLNGNRLLLHVLDRRMPIEQEVRNTEVQVARLFRIAL